MRPLFLHMDDALDGQASLLERGLAAGGRRIAVRDLGPALRLRARPPVLKRLEARLIAPAPSRPPEITFAGSGDFHRAAQLLLVRAIEPLLRRFAYEAQTPRYARPLHAISGEQLGIGNMLDRSFRLRGSPRKGILLLHGLTGAPSEMKFLARQLHRQGFDIYAPQLAGHGGDARALLATSWRDWLHSVRRAYGRYRTEVEEVYVAGFGVGGALGLLLAAERPEIKACAVYSMTFVYDGWSMGRWSSAAGLIQIVANLPFVRWISFEEPYPHGIKDHRLRDRILRMPMGFAHGALGRLPLGALYQMYRLGRRVLREGRRITVPTLILHAQHDDVSNPRNAERLRDCLAGRTTLRFLDDSYHMIHIDLERNRVAALTGLFFGNEEIAPAPLERMDA